MITICPCKDCPNRNASCHSSCESYKEWSEENERLREERNEATRLAYLSRPDKPKRRRR